MISVPKNEVCKMWEQTTWTDYTYTEKV